MTKKTFIQAANIIHNIGSGNWTNDPPSWADGRRFFDDAEYRLAVQVAESMIQLFVEGNPRFDTRRFLTACGLGE